ncbi:MAG: WYL domain-containing protein [Azoarcus sp.]|jgi:hypothetical protein|nr:WYL domain-containing protein [Azoarcus sp.]
MAKRPDSRAGIILALEILKRIPRKGSRKISAPELCEQLEGIGISRVLRTIQRQLVVLPFERPAGFDLEKYEADGHFRFGEGKSIRLVFQMCADTAYFLKETPLSRDQEIRELADGWLEICATVTDDQRWQAWLKSFDEDEVREVRVGSRGPEG